MSWYWGERNNEPWADWEDEALRKMWDTGHSARAILAALKLGRKWRTTRVHAARLGFRAHLKRPDVEELLAEQDKETVPTDDSPTLVYYFLGRFSPGQLPEVDQVREIHEAEGKVWLGSTVATKISVFTWQSRFAPLAAPIATSTPMLAWTT
jgi:hypothetical protein